MGRESAIHAEYGVIPCQNSTFCLQHCCFELLLVFTFQYSTSQFNILHSKFNVHNLNATLFIEHETFLFNVQCMRCKMRYASNAIQHPCSLHSQSISIFCFHISSFNMQHSCLSMQLLTLANRGGLCYCWFLASLHD